MQPIALNDVIEQIGFHFTNGTAADMQAVDRLLWDALNQHDENPHLWHYAGWYFNHVGNHAVAAQCLKRCYELESNPIVLANIGKTLRSQQRTDKALQVIAAALERLPEDADTLGAAAVCYVAEGNPDPGIVYGERALALQDNPEMRFNVGLLHLEAENFARGFDLYATGKHRWRENRMYATDEASEPPVLDPVLHEKLTEHTLGGRVKPSLLVYGEQGIGDEIMFSTLLREVAEDYRIVFDCHPRLESLHRQSNWYREGTDHIFPTRKERDVEKRREVLTVDVGAKTAIGNLCRIYRRRSVDFGDAWSQLPLFNAEHWAQECRIYYEHLKKAAAGRTIVGLAMRGGVFHTSTKHRRLGEEAISALMSREEYFYVGLDYEDMLGTGKWIAEKFGENKYVWPAAVNFAWDYHHVAALIKATDVVVSVPQSVAHLSAAIAHPTIVLNPIQTAWRETGGPTWYWYGPHAQMLRMREPGKWPIEELFDYLSRWSNAR